jgi:cytochrome c-type biogenesis protein
MAEINIIIAFTAGIISFLAPCVLPLVPGFLAYLAGSGTGEQGQSRRSIFINAIFFVLGFSLIFSALGVLLSTVLAHIAYDVQIWLSRVGGAIIIFFGLYLIGLFTIPFLEREHKFRVTRKFGSRYLTSFVFGVAFAVGWTPCVGPALGVILGLATSNPGAAFYLLLAYSLGLGVPFLLVGLFTAQATSLIQKFADKIKYFNIAFGVILVIIGILIFTNNLARIANFSLLNQFLLK